MSSLSLVAAFTETSGDDPSTGLTLAEIALYLYATNISTGVETQIWDGTQNPTSEITDMGMYMRIYPTADLDTYNYHGGALYSGAVAVDAKWVSGSVSGIQLFPIGSIEFTYTMFEADLVTPIPGVEIFISRNNPTGQVQDASIIWSGLTDSAGIALDIEGNKPNLDAGTHLFWRQKTGYSFTEPDTEVVS